MADDTQVTLQKTAEQAVKAFEMNLEMGRAFLQTWAKQIQNSAPATGGAQTLPFADASKVWIGAVTEATRRTQEAFLKGETLNADAYADIWSAAASQVAQEIVKDSAFAHLTGQWVNAAAKAKGEAKRVAEERLRDLGFATSGDVSEVSKRLIELERRVHDLQVLVEDRVVPGLAKEPKSAKSK